MNTYDDKLLPIPSISVRSGTASTTNLFKLFNRNRTITDANFTESWREKVRD